MARKKLFGVATEKEAGTLKLDLLVGATVNCYQAGTVVVISQYATEGAGAPSVILTDAQGNFEFWINDDAVNARIKLEVIPVVGATQTEDDIQAFSTAEIVITDTTNFDGKLSPTDVDSQKAFDTLDDHTHAHSEITTVGVDDHHDQLHAVSHVTGAGDEITPSDIGAEPADSTIMKEGENVSLLNNDANYQNDTDVAGVIATHSSNADAHHSQVHDLAGADHNSATKAELVAKLSDVTEMLTNISNEINGFTADTAPAFDDIIVTEDASATFAKRKVTRSDFLGDRFEWFPSSQDTPLGDYLVYAIAKSGIGYITFSIPETARVISSIDVILIPLSTEAASPVDLYSDYGAIGEPYNQHSQSLLAQTFPLTADQLMSFDMTSLYTSAVAGDYCGLQFNRSAVTGNTVGVLGVRVGYRE